MYSNDVTVRIDRSGFHIPINDGPISLSSTVLNPFSPVPTKDITKPTATVPSPT